MNLSIVIPAFNEEKSIRHTLLGLKEGIKGDYEVIVVDDYSSDNTRVVVEKISKDFKNLRLITNQSKKGFANALRAGFGAAHNEVVIPVMADFCDEIELIPQMCSKILEGYDIACGSRYIKGGRRQGSPFLKTTASNYFNRLLRLITNVPNTDLTNPFKAYRRCVLEKIRAKSNGFEISLEIALKAYFAGYKITELPTIWRERAFGKSHFVFFRDGMRFARGFLYAICKDGR